MSEAQVEAIVDAWGRRNARAKGRAVLAALQQATPVDTGDARRRWRITAEGRRGLVWETVISNDSDHIRFIIFGHGWIYPVRARALHWRDRTGEHFAMSVRPQEPNDFIARVIAEQSDAVWKFHRR